MSVYSELLKHAQERGKYNIDLINKSLKIGKQYYIKDGVIKVDDELIAMNDIKNLSIGYVDLESWEIVRDLYSKFKCSIPLASYHSHSYFKAKKYEELTQADLAFGESRHYAHAMLEGYVLLASMAGLLKWENENHWFWQDPVDKDLIVLRNWIIK